MSATSLAAVQKHSHGNAPLKTKYHFPVSLKQKLQLALHATLNIDDLLNTFLKEASTLISLHGLHYRHKALAIYHQCGKRGKDAKEYQLRQNNDSRGAITLYNQVGFTSDELSAIEELLTLLVQPLTNALQYSTILQGAMVDALTHLPNRAAFTDALHREMHLAKRHSLPLSILAIDIDHFKSVNDTYGHYAGDAYLAAFSRALRSACRGSDACFRLGGEEFMILCPKTDISGAILLAERIRSAIEELQVPFQQYVLSTSVSIGAAGYFDDKSASGFVDKADQALYRAKNQGRNLVCS